MNNKENILTTENPFNNNWYSFVRTLLFSNEELTYNEEETKARKYTRIAEYIATFKNGELIGDPMTIEDLITDVKATAILDYDGLGNYISYNDFSEESIYSVEDIEDLKKHKDTHFVMWYNK